MFNFEGENAARNQRDQGFPSESPQEGRQECQNKEECRQCQVQGTNQLNRYIRVPIGL